MSIQSEMFKRRVLPRLVVLLIILASLLLLFLARPGFTAQASHCLDEQVDGEGDAQDIECGHEPEQGPTCEEGERRQGGVCMPIIDCGKNPYKWNPFEEAYQREFIKWCEPFTGDPNETTYDGLTCDEVAAEMGRSEHSFCDWSEVFG